MTNVPAIDGPSFSIRLSPEDRAALAELCALYGLNRPDSIRRAMRQALIWKTRLGKSGYFVTAGTAQAAVFPIRLRGKAVHE